MLASCLHVERTKRKNEIFRPIPGLMIEIEARDGTLNLNQGDANWHLGGLFSTRTRFGMH
jgi:hypothetical protein